jgi:hypothetical protein
MSLNVGPPQARPLAKEQRAAVLAALKDRLSKRYVDRKRRAAIVASLTQRERAGAYDIADPMVFASKLTRDLQTFGKDGHLRLIFDPEEASLLYKDGGAGVVTPAMIVEQAQAARRFNHGITEQRMFPGNVRYVRLQTFKRWTGEESEKAYDRAMMFLAGGDAIILDVRGNNGGPPEPYIYLMSHFVAPRTLLFTLFRDEKKAYEKRALDSLPAGRLSGKPLYVLTDAKTFSGGEFVAYDVRHRKLGEIIGTKTAGAANEMHALPLTHGFVANISVGSPIFPATGSNWEGEGITPDIETPADLALDTALLRATEKLASTAPASLKQLAEEEVERLRDQLAKRKAVPRSPFLGFASGRGATPREGMPIDFVPADGTFAKMGVQEGDIFIEGNGIKIVSEAAVEEFIQSAKTGEPIRVTVRRSGKTMQLSGVVVGRSSERAVTWW